MKRLKDIREEFKVKQKGPLMSTHAADDHNTNPQLFYDHLSKALKALKMVHDEFLDSSYHGPLLSDGAYKALWDMQSQTFSEIRDSIVTNRDKTAFSIMIKNIMIRCGYGKEFVKYMLEN